MDRKIWLVLAATLLVGCQTQTPLENPFMPQTTVPPPGTAGTAPAFGAPQVQMAPAAATPGAVTMPQTFGAPAAAATPQAFTPPQTFGTPTAVPPNTTLPGATAPPATLPGAGGTSTPYYPPASPGGSFDFRQGSIQAPRDLGITLDYGDGIPVAAGSLDTAQVESREQEQAGAMTEMAASVNPAAGGAWSPRRETTVQLASAANHSAQVQVAAYPDDNDSRIAQASYHESNRKPSPARHAGKFSHSDDYRRLTGQLEYSTTLRQWKLRYIPLDGETDQYGGSVVIADGAALAGHRPGEFVTIEGEITSDKAAASRFAPKYHAANVSRAE